MKDFSGAKLALLCADALIAYKRDDKEGIPFPGFWDLPGGGREGDETPVQCALRELEEEFSLRIAPERLHWLRRYEGKTPHALPSYFLVGTVRPEEIHAIRFGSEGECWRMMEIDAFLSSPAAVPHLQRRLLHYIADSSLV